MTEKREKFSFNVGTVLARRFRHRRGTASGFPVHGCSLADIESNAPNHRLLIGA